VTYKVNFHYFNQTKQTAMKFEGFEKKLHSL